MAGEAAADSAVEATRLRLGEAEVSCPCGRGAKNANRKDRKLKCKTNAKTCKKCKCKKCKTMQLTRERIGPRQKRPFKKVQMFSPAPLSPVKTFFPRHKMQEGLDKSQKMQTNANNATYKRKGPLQKKYTNNATTQQKMQNGPKCKNMDLHI